MVPILIWICKIQWWCSLFSFSPKNTFFGANLVQKIKAVGLNWNLVSRLIRTCTIQWWCWSFLFSTKNTLSGQFVPKKQNCQFKVKSGTLINSNMHNSMVMFTFRTEIPFLGNFDPKSQKCQLKLKFGT